MLDGATYNQHDCRTQTTWKKSYVKLLQIVSPVIMYATNNSVIEYRFRQLVELFFEG